MIKSMTGYGRGEITSTGRKLTVEVRSVNNRYLDCSVRMPRGWLFAEESVKSRVGQSISRGKVDVFLNVEETDSETVSLYMNEPLANAYIDVLAKLHRMGKDRGVKKKISPAQVAQFPDVLRCEKEREDPEAIRADILSALNLALEDFNGMRTREGQRLAEDVLSHAQTVEGFVGRIEELSPVTVKEYQCRMEEKMRELLGDTQVDERLLLNEAALFADKIAVDEETVRLRSHLGQLREMLKSGGAIGRKLDFLIQEFNREANTIGSKCSDLEITRVVVDMKAEIEKIREQMQNIE